MALIEFEEYRQKLNGLQPAIDELGQAYDLEHAAEEVEELENRASEPGFWDDMEKSQKILQRTKALKDKLLTDSFLFYIRTFVCIILKIYVLVKST